MKINNISHFDKSQLYYCHNPKIQDFLYNKKNIVYISKDMDGDGNTFWIYFKSTILKEALDELGV